MSAGAISATAHDTRPAGRLTRAWLRAAGARLAGVLALLALLLAPRLLAPAPFVTADEDNWLVRGARFRVALADGDWAATYQNGHPGVVTMWLVAAALGTDEARAADRGAARSLAREGVTSGFPAFARDLARARLALALAAALLLAALAAALAPHVGWRPAWLAALLLGWDPFPLALSRAAHVDAPLLLLATLALLAGTAHWRGRAGRPLLLACGAATGLAILSKSPGLLLVPCLPLAALWCRRLRPAAERPPLAPFLGGLALWALVAAATALLAWPALLVDPLGTARAVLAFAQAQGDDPEGRTFLLGVAWKDAGPLFYPLVLLFRGGPLLWLGLLAGLWALVRRRGWRRADLALVGPLLAWAVLFIAAISLGAKKEDRYLLPSLAALDIVAVLGLLALARGSRARTAGVVAGAVLLQAGCVAWSAPYYSTFYNPLAGGPAVAQRAIPVGWGEGLEQVAAYLDAQPRAERLTVISQNYDVLRPQFAGRGQPLRDDPRAKADYLVLTLAGVQEHKHVGAYEEYLKRGHLVFTARIRGLEYAWVYRLDPKAAPADSAPADRDATDSGGG